MCCLTIQYMFAIDPTVSILPSGIFASRLMFFPRSEGLEEKSLQHKTRAIWIAQQLSTMGFLLLIVYSVVIVFVAYALLCSDSSSSGFLGKFNWFLTKGLWRGLLMICGRRVANGIASFFDWAINKPNPLLQILYSVLVVGGYLMFVKDAFPMMPNPYVPEYHKYIAHLGVSITMGLFLYCSISDPGRVTSDNAQAFIKVFPYDEMLYHPKNCTTCLIPRPARSKHCSLCKKCVARFDHHCPWINNCVGDFNLRWFLLFLFATGVLCSYCAYLCGYNLYAMLQGSKIFQMKYKDPTTGLVSDVPYSIMLGFCLQYGGTLFPLGFFTGVISLVMYGFLGYHLWLLRHNTTTNEQYKWQDYMDYVSWYKSRQDEQAKGNTPKEDKSDDVSFKDLPPPKYTVGKSGAIHLKNMYNKGYWNNLKSILLPPAASLVGKPNKGAATFKKRH